MSAAKPSPDRRAILGESLALASAVTASAACATAAAPLIHDADAGLHALCVAHGAAEARCEEIGRFFDDAEERYVAPPVPSALLHQPDRDTFEICYQPDHLQSVEIDGAWCKLYSSDQDVPALRWKIGKWREYDTGRNVVDRAEEIIAALDVYVPAVKRAEDAAGLTTCHEMSAANEARIHELLREITTTPATTMRGIVAKAHVATVQIGGGDGLSWLTNDTLPALLSEQPGAGVFQKRTLAIVMSVIIDAARLDMPGDATATTTAGAAA